MSGTWTERRDAWRGRYGEDDRLDLAGAVGAAALLVFAAGALAGLVYVIRAFGR